MTSKKDLLRKIDDLNKAIDSIETANRELRTRNATIHNELTTLQQDDLNLDWAINVADALGGKRIGVTSSQVSVETVDTPLAYTYAYQVPRQVATLEVTFTGPLATIFALNQALSRGPGKPGD